LIVNILEVQEAILKLPYEQQVMIINHWMGGTSCKTSSAPKVAATERPSTTQATKYSRDGMPYDERETEACDALLLQGFNSEEAARWFDKNRASQRTHAAWAMFALRRRDVLKAKGELK
jgi:hypothetical protein